ncbi:protein of unknown function [Pararobbsia alpina]
MDGDVVVVLLDDADVVFVVDEDFAVDAVCGDGALVTDEVRFAVEPLVAWIDMNISPNGFAG